MTNEIRSDALKVKIFTKTCTNNLDCKIKESNNNLSLEITKKILKTATLYKEEKEKEKK